MDPILNSAFLLIGLGILVYSADKLVLWASDLALFYGIPHIVIGMTVIAFGTSSPELIVNIFSSFNNQNELIVGNVIGSNLFNICVILGICSLFRNLTILHNTTWLEIPFGILAALSLVLMASDNWFQLNTANTLQRSEGLTLLLLFLIFLIYNLQLARKINDGSKIPTKPQSHFKMYKATIWIILSLIGLTLGGHLIVTSSSKIAQLFNISEHLIGITIVAMGTSLPELATSISAVKRNQVDLAVGNVVGSNLFNTFLVLGVSASIAPLPISKPLYNDLIFNLFIALLLFILALFGGRRRIIKREGLLLLALYVIYTVYLFYSGWKNI